MSIKTYKCQRDGCYNKFLAPHDLFKRRLIEEDGELVVKDLDVTCDACLYGSDRV